MARIGRPALIMAIAVASFALGTGTRSTIARFTDQETTTASYATGACFTNDAAAPTINSSLIAKTTPYLGGATRQGGSYYVYANIGAGATRASADVRSLTAGTFMAPMTSGSYTVAGVAYNWRTNALTVASPLAAGSYTYSVATGDSALRCRTVSATATVDNTAPAGSNVQPNNATGGTAGRPDPNDTLVFTFTEQIDPETVLSGWTGASTPVVVRITDNVSADAVTVWNSTNTVQLPLGSTNLADNYVTTNVTFGASGTASTMVQSGTNITITLGTQAGTTRQVTVNRTAVWTTAAGPTDAAGNASTSATVNEGGVADRNF